MKIVVTLFYFFTSCYAFSHAELFQLSNSEFIGNKYITSNFGFELNVNYSAFLNIEEIGIDYFNVGDDNKATLDLYVYDKSSKNQIIYRRTYIENVDYQNAYIPLNYFFKSNKSYVFLIVSDTSLVENKDNSVAFFKPRSLGSLYNESYFSVKSILESNSTSFPLLNSIESPFIHIGVTNNAMPDIINFMATNISQIYYSPYKVKSFSTQFRFLENNKSITHFGMFDVSLGPNNIAEFQIQLLDSNGFILKTEKKSFKNINAQRCEFDFSYELKKNNIYTINVTNVIESDTDNLFLLYKPIYSPFIDSTNTINVLSSSINGIRDTLFLSSYFYSFIDTNLLSSFSESSNLELYTVHNDIENKKCIITFDESFPIFHTSCYDAFGCVNNSFEVINNKIIFFPSTDVPRVYFFRVNSKIIKLFV